jgi:hypothetical protein
MNADPEIVDQIVHALTETAKHPYPKGRRPDNRWGYGFIRPAEALSLLWTALGSQFPDAAG